MSFILDALRKSENERQRESSASLARAPLAAVRHRVPVWSWFLIGLLSLALIALGTAWWRSESPETLVQAEAPVETVVPAPSAPVNEAASVNEVPALENLLPAAPESLLPPPLRSIRELADFAPDLPRLRLELLAYNGREPDGGSAWINGQRYFVGDKVVNGPELIEVRPDGVVLAYAGERFLLTTR